MAQDNGLFIAEMVKQFHCVLPARLRESNPVNRLVRITVAPLVKGDAVVRIRVVRQDYVILTCRKRPGHEDKALRTSAYSVGWALGRPQSRYFMLTWEVWSRLV